MNKTKELSIDSVGILGAGKMGGAIAKGLSRHLSPKNIRVYDPVSNPELDGLVSYVSGPAELEQSELILICTKPQSLRGSVASFRGKGRYISIAAGVSLQDLEEAIAGSNRDCLARAMPNLAATIGESMTAVYAENSELTEIAREVFSCIGRVEVLQDEELMHAFTALCGSGPAFVCAFVQGLAEGGVAAGLSYDQALPLALQTIRGSVQLLLQDKEHPAQLRNKVTSPAGTTIAGLERLEAHAFGGALMDAVQAAANRSRELS